MSFASASRMRTSLASLLLLTLAAAGCSSSTGATTAAEPEAAAAATLSEADRALLGSYEIPLRNVNFSEGSYSPRMRLDFVAGAKGVEAYLQSRNFYGLGLAHPAVVLTSDKATMEFALQGRAATLTIARKENGAPGAAVLVGYNGTTPYQGDVGPDITPPELSSGGGSNAPPWEPTSLAFSETLRAKDVVLPANGDLAYSLQEVAGTPWVSAINLRRALSSTWDGHSSVTLAPIDAKDPSGNPLPSLRQLQVYFAPVGKAVTAYDFAKDNPAFPSVVNRLVADCDGASACLRLSQGAKIGLRIAAGSRTLRVRFALRAGQFKGVPPKTTVVLGGVVAPGDGSATSPLPKLEVTWTPEAAPTATRAFATAYADLVIPLPKVDAETGVTLQFDGEPRDEAPTTTNPNQPPGVQTVEARHMVMLLQSARAE
jgi:hypothetical protein